eukprot:COSAG02_NODE_11570_length_1697_cov_99.140175_2_plen_133_part_00
MRKGKGAQSGESEDWREYRETYEALRDQARCVELLVVIGVHGSVSTTALREIVDITVEQNGGRAMRVDLNPKPSTLWRVLYNGPRSLGAHYGNWNESQPTRRLLRVHSARARLQAWQHGGRMMQAPWTRCIR